MYVGLKQPRGDGERYVTPARAAAKETSILVDRRYLRNLRRACAALDLSIGRSEMHSG